jgi:hypothetical protein
MTNSYHGFTVGQRVRNRRRGELGTVAGREGTLDPANPLHRALLRLKTGLAMGKIANPVPRDRP